MAKGKKRVLGVSTWTPDYEEPSQLPWPDIENTLGRQIPDEHRVEIFKARQRYFAWISTFDQGVPLEHVKKLRRRLLRLCGEIHSMKNSVDDASRYWEPDEYAQKLLGKGAGAGDIDRAFNGLEWQHACDIRDTFDSLAAECLELLKALNKPAILTMVTDGTSDAMAFYDLYDVLAKTAPTWDFKPREDSPDFVKLVMWMIGWSDFKQTKNKIKNARADYKKRIAGG